MEIALRGKGGGGHPTTIPCLPLAKLYELPVDSRREDVFLSLPFQQHC